MVIVADADGFGVGDALDELYAARPEEFTALRAELAARAKGSGDAAAAKTITASRKPTTAAWVVNTLVLGGPARTRLIELGSRLRDAHAAIDGEALRTLTAEQRKLIDELSRAGFRAADLADPTAALRDDVTATLQAAVADPDVAARLGRLTKAERWSGFGDFGFTATVSTTAKKSDKQQAAPRPAATPERDSVRDRRKQQAKADADAALTELQADLATARLRHQDARRRLQDAERAMTAAEDAYDAAKHASRDAGAAVKDAKSKLKDAGG